MERKNRTVNLPSCSFCGNGSSEPRQVVAWPEGYICSECVRPCIEVLEGKKKNLEHTFIVVDGGSKLCSLCGRKQEHSQKVFEHEIGSVCEQCVWSLDLAFEDSIKNWVVSHKNPLKEKEGFSPEEGWGYTTPDISEENLPVVTELKRVDNFNHPAHFIGSDCSSLFCIDVTVGCRKNNIKNIFSGIRGNVNDVAVTSSGDNAIISDGKTIWSVDVNGSTQEILKLEDLSSDDLPVAPDCYRILWHLSISLSEKCIYCYLLNTDENASGFFMARIDIAEKKLVAFTDKSLFGQCMDVDADSGIVYWPEGIRSYDGRIEGKYHARHEYFSSRLSPDKKKLLMSGIDDKDNPVTAVRDLESGEDNVLPFEGWMSIWLSDDSVLFLRDENSLWIYKLNESEPKSIMTIGSRRKQGSGMYYKMPKLSNDSTMLSMPFVSKDKENRFVFGTVLIDFKCKEYMVIDKSFNSSNWMK